MNIAETLLDEFIKRRKIILRDEHCRNFVKRVYKTPQNYFMRSLILPPEILCRIATFLPDTDDNVKAQLLCFAGYPYNDVLCARTEEERCDAIARTDAVLLCEPEDPRLKIHYFAPIPRLLRSVVQHEAWRILNYMMHHVGNWGRLLYWYFAEMGKLNLVKWCRPFCKPHDFTAAGYFHAAKYGHLDIIRWLADALDEAIPVYEIVNVAAKHGHLHILKWVFQKGYTNHFTTLTHFIAEEAGQRAVLEWLIQNTRPSGHVWYDGLNDCESAWSI